MFPLFGILDPGPVPAVETEDAPRKKPFFGRSLVPVEATAGRDTTLDDDQAGDNRPTGSRLRQIGKMLTHLLGKRR